MGDNIYLNYWTLLMPSITQQLSDNDNTIRMNVAGLADYGDRKSYYSNFKVVKGELIISNNAYAQGRDFHQAFIATEYFKKNLADRIVQVTITKNLSLEINMEDQLPPQFFTQSDFDELAKFIGDRFERSNLDMVATYTSLSEVYKKVEYWALQVKEHLFSNGKVAIIKKPTNRASNFETYFWAKIYPSEDLLEWKLLAYTVTLSNSDGFSVKIDTISLGDNDPLRKKYLEFRGDFFNSPIVKIFDLKEVLDSDWNNLITRSIDAIKSFQNDYNKLLQILNYDKANTVQEQPADDHDANFALNSILYGPPGTGKTYNSIDLAVKIINKKSSNSHSANKREFDTLRSTGQIEFVTFHQNYTYEDFIIGIRPDANHDSLRFVPYKGIFYQMCKRARENYESSQSGSGRKNFVLIIDEINRANISKVFGELITLLEDDKRISGDNELYVTLPNGEKDFAIPPNLYVVGTMNTADKSIALIDVALRRRFEFIGKYPDYTKLNSDSKDLLEKVNTAIYNLRHSADFLIGHAYFIKNPPIEQVLRNKVIPLLMEYFSGKTDVISNIFTETNWSVSYDTKTFGWNIRNKEYGNSI
jgi:hypothetical protein